MPNNPIDALQLILAARADHLARFTPDYDITRHNDGDLTAAAECYLRDARYQLTGAGRMERPPARWPFADDEWSTGTIAEQLAKGAALAAAEIDRWNGLADINRAMPVQS